MMGTYAANTDVTSDRSRAEIERILTRWGADEYAYMMGRERAQMAFRVAQESSARPGQ